MKLPFSLFSDAEDKSLSTVCHFHPITQIHPLRQGKAKMDVKKEFGLSNTAAEMQLVETGKFAILSVQLNAYLPLTVVNGKLRMEFCSLVFVSQCLFHLLFISISCFSFWYHQETINGVREDRTFTENLVTEAFGYVTNLITIWLRVNGVWSRNSTLKFWKRNANLLQEFKSTADLSSLDSKLQEIGKSIRNSAGILLFLILSHIGIGIYCQYTNTGIYSEYGKNGNIPIMFILTMYFYLLLILTHSGHGIWLCFFLKLYSALLHTIQIKLESIATAIDEIVEPSLESSSDTKWIEFQLRGCYKLYLSLEEQVKDFSNHFRKQLLAECILALLSTTVCIFLFCRWGVASNLSIEACIPLILPMVIFGATLYNLGTGGSQLSRAASGVQDQLHKVFVTCGSSLGCHSRQELQMFGMKISTSPPSVDAGQFFTCNRRLLTTVSLHFKYSMRVMFFI